MKNTKKLLSLLLVFVMTLTLANGFAAKATTAITVTLRIEQDCATMVKPVQITLNDEDLKDYGLDLPTDKLTPMHALAKYMITTCGATEENIDEYIDFSYSWLSDISTTGKIDENSNFSSVNPSLYDTYWMYAVNDEAPLDPETGYGCMTDGYELQDKDDIVFYGVWGGDYTNGISPYYTCFDKKEYTVTKGEDCVVSLLGFDAMNDAGKKAYMTMSEAWIMATEEKDATNGATEQNNITAMPTDQDGKAAFNFGSAGTYILSAYRKAADGTNYDISRPYAVVYVKDSASTPTAAPTPTPDNNVKKTDPTPSPTPSGTEVSSKNTKPLKPTGLKATVKKSAKKKKTIKLTWKVAKCGKVDGYRVYLSKKAKKGYKKLADTKKAKLTFKRKKGTYYVKVKAYKKTGSKRLYSSYSKALKIKVKK